MTNPRINPLWTGSAELGREVLSAPDRAGLQTVLHMKEWGMPALWTVALGLSFDASAISGEGDGQFGVDALVQFGSGKAKQEFEVDWAEGTTFSLPMNTVKIVARLSDFARKSNTPSGLRLRANLALGGALHGSATKSVKVILPTGPAELNGIPIPRFARRVSVQNGLGVSLKGLGAWSPETVYRFMGGLGTSGDTGGFTGEQFLGGGFAAQGVPIPPTARSLLIRNGASKSFSALVIFHLAF